MNKKCLIVVFVITLFGALLFCNNSYAGTQELNDLKYEVSLNSDGSMNVTETWDIKVAYTNTLFKSFKLDRSKYGDIVDVTVEEIMDNGEVISFFDTGRYAYHVQKGGYYAAMGNTRGIFEIGWGVSIPEEENKIYKIKYKVQDAIKTYNDCSEFYWQFIGNINEIPTKKVTGTIKLPSKVTDISNLRAWAHGPLNGNVEITNNEMISFEVEDLPTKTMVELRVVTLENNFYLNNNKYTIDNFNNILAEETKWANEANHHRMMAKMKIIVAVGIYVAIMGFLIIKIITYTKKLSNVKKSKKVEIEYFRDIPNENSTPAEAAFLYYFDKKYSFSANISEIVSATMLDLALKKMISFEVGPREEIFIYIHNNEDIKLKADEKSIYILLKDVKEYKQRKKKNELIEKISMKDIEKFAMNNNSAFMSKVKGIERFAEVAQTKEENYKSGLLEESDKWGGKRIAYLIVGLFLLFFIIPVLISILCLVCSSLCNKISNNMRCLTDKGEEEKAKWKGLKKYMEEFSLLNEREVPELVLWEKYLVFATAFGIADKVIEQLKTRYPQMLDNTYMSNSNFTYMHMMNRMNFNRAMCSGISNAYSASFASTISSSHSSGGGFGGGFSGGGRTAAEEAAGMGGR